MVLGILSFVLLNVFVCMGCWAQCDLIMLMINVKQEVWGRQPQHEVLKRDIGFLLLLKLNNIFCINILFFTVHLSAD